MHEQISDLQLIIIIKYEENSIQPTPKESYYSFLENVELTDFEAYY